MKFQGVVRKFDCRHIQAASLPARFESGVVELLIGSWTASFVDPSLLQRASQGEACGSSVGRGAKYARIGLGVASCRQSSGNTAARIASGEQ